MKQDESNLISLLVGVGIGWLGFSSDGQQLIRKVFNTAKDKYVVKKDEKKEGKENAESE